MTTLFKHRALSYMSFSHSFHKQLLGSNSRLGAVLGSQHIKINRVGVLALREFTHYLVRWAWKLTHAIPCAIIKGTSKDRDGLCESGMTPYRKSLFRWVSKYE